MTHIFFFFSFSPFFYLLLIDPVSYNNDTESNQDPSTSANITPASITPDSITPNSISPRSITPISLSRSVSPVTTSSSIPKKRKWRRGKQRDSEHEDDSEDLYPDKDTGIYIYIYIIYLNIHYLFLK